MGFLLIPDFDQNSYHVGKCTFCGLPRPKTHSHVVRGPMVDNLGNLDICMRCVKEMATQGMDMLGPVASKRLRDLVADQASELDAVRAENADLVSSLNTILSLKDKLLVWPEPDEDPDPDPEPQDGYMPDEAA